MCRKKIKQVIVMRKDLNMRKGKMIAQGSHASLKVILDMMTLSDSTSNVVDRRLFLSKQNPVNRWLEGSFTKICLYVMSEKDLLSIYSICLHSDIPVALIQDNGLTEFNGKKTNTCLAIGPWFSEDIDKITGDLKCL